MASQDDTTIVPWVSPEQFLKVYKMLFSRTVADKRWALDEISVWENLCYPALPVPIEASVFLVRALVQDMLSDVGTSFFQEKDIQSLYALGLVRFVNLILEGDKETSVYRDIAIKYNLPPWIVDIRHDATHSHCPSLPVLRIGAEKALEYLEVHFWKKAALKIAPVKRPLNTDREMLENLLSSFRAVQFNSIKNRKDEDESPSEQDPLVKNVTAKIRYFAERSPQLYVEILAQPGVFLDPNDLMHLLCNIGRMFMEQDDEIALPNEVEEFWRPIMSGLHHLDMLPTFMELLLLNLQNCHIPLCQKVAIAWVMEILSSMNHQSKSTLSHMYAKKPWKIDYIRLIHACMQGACKFSHFLLSYIVTRLEGEGNLDRYNELFCLLALRQGRCVDEKDLPKTPRHKDKDLVFTLDDLEEDLGQMKTVCLNIQRKNEFSMAPVDMDFSNIPIGATLNPVVPQIEEPVPLNDTTIDVTERMLVDENGTDNEGALEETINSDDNSFQETVSIGMVKMMYRRR